VYLQVYHPAPTKNNHAPHLLQPSSPIIDISNFKNFPEGKQDKNVKEYFKIV
jgi:hypothetical protein